MHAITGVLCLRNYDNMIYGCNFSAPHPEISWCLLQISGEEFVREDGKIRFQPSLPKKACEEALLLFLRNYAWQ